MLNGLEIRDTKVGRSPGLDSAQHFQRQSLFLVLSTYDALVTLMVALF
jgi:hypothetical protein